VRERWRLETRSGEIERRARPIRPRASRVAAASASASRRSCAEADGTAAALAERRGGEAPTQRALLELALRIPPHEREAALPTLAPPVARLARARPSASRPAEPALRWLTQNRDLGADAAGWARYLEARVRRRRQRDPRRAGPARRAERGATRRRRAMSRPARREAASGLPRAARSTCSRSASSCEARAAARRDARPARQVRHGSLLARPARRHAVVLLKLRDLQRLGHTIVLIVGDATAMVGDPSGATSCARSSRARRSTRTSSRTRSRPGSCSTWRRPRCGATRSGSTRMRFEDLLRLLGRRTVAQTLAREDFQKRLPSDAPIGLHELVYPVMQGWDSVMVRADVEFGGTDQLFNLLVGRDLQAQEGQEPQVVLTTPLDQRPRRAQDVEVLRQHDRAHRCAAGGLRQDDEHRRRGDAGVVRAPDARPGRGTQALLAGHPARGQGAACRELGRLLHGSAAARRRARRIRQPLRREGEAEGRSPLVLDASSNVRPGTS
jgi:hypothetical protein